MTTDEFTELLADLSGRIEGWKVYAPHSVHCPTVSGGRPYVLYMLPEGAIEFTRS